MTEDWRELLPTAFLLAGSDAGARDLLARGLARGGGVDGLVRAHLRRRVGRDVVLSGTSGTPWWVSPADAAAAAELAAALDALTRAERAAVVLHWFEDRPAAEVAQRVPGVDLAALPGRLGVPADRLPARLELLAGTAQLGDLDDAAVADGVRAVRRRRWVRAGTAVAAVAVLAVGAATLPGVVRPPAPAAEAPASTLGPARGSLAGDTGFVAALRDRLDPAPDPPRLVYAGDAAGRRWALLAQRTGDGLQVTWFTGPASTPAAFLDRALTTTSDTPAPVLAATAEDERGAALLLVTAPGDEVEVSSGVDVAADGSTSRSFRPVGTADGVSAVRLDRDGGQGVVARVSRDGLPVWTGPASSLLTQGAAAPPSAVPRSGTAPVDPLAYEVAVDAVAGPTGRRPGSLAVTVLGSGTFPAPGGATAQAVTVAVALPGGAVATSTASATPDGSGTPCGTATHPAGTDLATLTVVARCASYAGDSSTFGATLVVVAPPGQEVELNTGAGGALTAPALEAGWGFQVDGADDLTVFRADSASGEVARVGGGPLDGP
ncbi:hypothetical protein [Klenkia brasiliensis]|uniref:DNA-directed RNA polymerase specialized sigma subunit, sigma24 family n=1 Tax=Klenkia brasiliensis TaxID=333142 RepID=A0A1G7MD95_9ACTN|nr:hypothetical protein [Klenkia brasiliensis]SDF59681.1 hypothetical protein SAMN05660324_0588 [Klenkia brasiliensis]